MNRTFRTVIKSIAWVIVLLIITAGWFLSRFVAKLLEEDLSTQPSFSYQPGLDIDRVSSEGVPYTINNSTATFKLDTCKPDAHSQRLFPSYAEAWVHAVKNRLPILPSMQMVHGKCKVFNDRLVAALEQQIQTGLPDAIATGKQEALRHLAQALLEASASSKDPDVAPLQKAVVHVITGLELGGVPWELEPSLRRQVTAEKQAFLADPLRSRPVGFWSEHEAQSRLFQQDRYLAEGFLLQEDPEVCMVLATIMAGDALLESAFTQIRAFHAACANPPCMVRDMQPAGRFVPPADLDALLPSEAILSERLTPSAIRAFKAACMRQYGDGAGTALVPYAQSKEHDFFMKLTSLGRIQSLDAIIEAVQSGQISLEPKPDSGWYDYQWYALETLILPERAYESEKLLMTDRYKHRLKEAFKTALAKERETQIKVLPVSVIGSLSEGNPGKPIDIGPTFSAEPLATFYLRTARAYRFIDRALMAVLGETYWRDAREHRDLEAMALLLYGIHEQVCLELGLLPDYLPDEMDAGRRAQARDAALTWLKAASQDPDLARDTRFAVPAATDASVQPPQTWYWSTVGIRLQRVRYEYGEEPAVKGSGFHAVPTWYYLPTDVALEFTRPPSEAPLNRKDFQALCDRFPDVRKLNRHLGVNGFSRRAFGLRLAGLLIFILLVTGLLLYAWRTIPRPCRRKLTMILAVTAVVILSLWILLMVFSPVYRYKFLARHIFSKHTNLATLYVMRTSWSIGDEKAEDFLRANMDLLRDGHDQVRYLAAHNMGYCLSTREAARQARQIPGMESTLLRAAEDSMPVISGLALYQLGLIYKERHADFIASHLNRHRDDEEACVYTLMGLSDSVEPHLFDTILSFADDHRELVRNAVATLLRRYVQEDETLLEGVIALTESPKPRTRETAVLTFARLYRDEYAWTDGEGVLRPEVDQTLLKAVRHPGNSLKTKLMAFGHIRNPAMQREGLERILPFFGTQTDSRTVLWFTSEIKALNERTGSGDLAPVLKAGLNMYDLHPELRNMIEDLLEQNERKGRKGSARQVESGSRGALRKGLRMEIFPA